MKCKGTSFFVKKHNFNVFLIFTQNIGVNMCINCNIYFIFGENFAML